MRTIHLFDVDGTLTPAKQRAHPKFKKQFFKWSSDKEVYLVSGGSFVRLCEQLGPDVMDNMSAVFSCMGNVCYRRKKDEPRAWFKEYENKFEPPKALLDELDLIVSMSPYDTKTGNHYEVRQGTMNFSIVGRRASNAQRQAYAQYDAEHAERMKIVKSLREGYKDLDFVIGGAVSIDIFPNGNDKSQVMRNYFKDLPKDATINFVGDRTEAPGNDYALAVEVEKMKNGKTHPVESWKDTAVLLSTDAFSV
jgi:phosphomannomutase|tara:strand:- start:209 stop:958 length:750 start_codon:yes stop_codon:yes gene_type:complete